ncbi:MAG TPA: T9SS type A sorting domain-containing protein [Ignavibacteriaceae bacterium]|nr:T9SS type A sorting domain-containing protein [Ignavibacteriaceae bacterium]
MKYSFLLIFVALGVILFSLNQTKSQPSFNGTSPGCAGSGCHTLTSGIVTATVLTNNQIRISVSGASGSVAGELVDTNGVVVAVNNSTSSNPFTLTAPGAGTYTINAGYKNPARRYGSTTVSINITGVNEKFDNSIPLEYNLYSNYPNPFNPSTMIRFSIPQSSFTTLKIYDIEGKEVASLLNEMKSAGNYEVTFNASQLPSGAYFYRIESGNFSSTKKMILLK